MGSAGVLTVHSAGVGDDEGEDGSKESNGEEGIQSPRGGAVPPSQQGHIQRRGGGGDNRRSPTLLTLSRADLAALISSGWKTRCGQRRYSPHPVGA